MITDLRIKFTDICIIGISDDDECEDSSNLDHLIIKSSSAANNISLTVTFPTLLKYAFEWSDFKTGSVGNITHYVSAYFIPFAKADNYSSSFPCPSSKNEEFEISYHLECLPCYQDAYAKRIFEETSTYLMRLNAPSDVRLQLYSGETEEFFETPTCDESGSVPRKSLMFETHSFLERLRSHEMLTVHSLINLIEKPISKDMDVRDENGNSILHLLQRRVKSLWCLKNFWN